MTEKQFNVFDVDGTVFLEDHKEGSYHIGEKENVDIPCLNDIADRLNTYADENEQLKQQLILANGFIKMIENCYEDMTIEDILYEKYGEFQDELHLQMAIAKEEIE